MAQAESLKQSRQDLDVLRRELAEFHKAHAEATQLGDKLSADRASLEAFGERATALLSRTPELESRMDTVLSKMALVDEGTKAATRLGELGGGTRRAAHARGRSPAVHREARDPHQQPPRRDVGRRPQAGRAARAPHRGRVAQGPVRHAGHAGGGRAAEAGRRGRAAAASPPAHRAGRGHHAVPRTVAATRRIREERRCHRPRAEGAPHRARRAGQVAGVGGRGEPQAGAGRQRRAVARRPRSRKRC